MSSFRSLVSQELRRLDRSSPDFDSQLYDVLCQREYIQGAKNLGRNDLVWLIDYLDEVRRHIVVLRSPFRPAQSLNCLDSTSPTSKECLRALRSICGARATLPTSYTLPSQLLEIDPAPFTSGGSCDVHKGTLTGSTVFIKRFQVNSQDNQRKAAEVHF
jgi:hypothetical protein